jgi:tagaturonate reductase
LGFAAFLLFLKCSKNDKGQFEGTANGTSYIIQDDNAAYFADKWQQHDAVAVVDAVLADSAFWGADLSKLPGFSDAVKLNLNSLIKKGVAETINNIQLNKKEA